jgi:hypothetical protein
MAGGSPDLDRRTAHVHQAVGVVAVQADCTPTAAMDRLIAFAGARGQNLEHAALDVLDGLSHFDERWPSRWGSGAGSGETLADDAHEQARIAQAQGIISQYDNCTALDGLLKMNECARTNDRALVDVASTVIEGHARVLIERGVLRGTRHRAAHNAG